MAEEQVEKPLIDPKLVSTKTSKAPAAAKKPKSIKGKEKYGYFWGTGRRKSAVARVRIRPGQGEMVINKQQLEKYFARLEDRQAVLAPLKAIDSQKRFDVFVNVKGGGTTGQSGATRLGLARALKNFDISLVPILRQGGHLTRDSRMVERKKYGQRGARRRFQFSKR